MVRCVRGARCRLGPKFSDECRSPTPVCVCACVCARARACVWVADGVRVACGAGRGDGSHAGGRCEHYAAGAWAVITCLLGQPAPEQSLRASPCHPPPAWLLERALQVRREVLQLESEYDSWRRQLDQKQEELKRLKAEKTQRRRELRGNDSVSGPMAELMHTLGQLQRDIAEASAKALNMDERIDEAKLSALHLEASEDELKQEFEEVHALRVAEETKAQEMQAKIAQTQSDLNARDEDLRRIKRSMEQHAGSLDGHQGDHFKGQEKLAKDMGDLETLSNVLPHLDEDIREGASQMIRG